MPDSVQMLNDLRTRVLQNEEVEPEEYRKVLDALRQDRMAADRKSKPSGKSSSAAGIDVASILNTLN